MSSDSPPMPPRVPAAQGGPPPVPAGPQGGPPPVPAAALGGPPPVPAAALGGPPPVPAAALGGPPPVPAAALGGPPPVPAAALGGPPPVPAAALRPQPEPARPMSAGAGQVFEYVRNFMPQGGLDQGTVSRLKYGSEAMMATRGKVNVGRGNVDTETTAPRRTKLAHELMEDRDFTDLGGVAAATELTRAGSCDEMSAHALIEAGNLMSENDSIAKVESSHHTFAEIRQSDGARRNKDAIVDAWAESPHAILRQDSEFGGDANHLLSLPRQENFADKAEAMRQVSKRDRIVAKHQGKIPQIERDAQVPLSPIPWTVWDRTSIFSGAGADSKRQRAEAFEQQSPLRKTLQTVYAAKQLGANTRSAVRQANATMPAITHRALGRNAPEQ